MSDARPELLVTAFSDYICPFCYVGDARLNRLREAFRVRINWCLLEIHPETPPEGQPVRELGYDTETWERLMAALDVLAAEEGLQFAEHTFTTNSHRALLLAEAAKELGAASFYPLHRALFEAFLRDGRNLGDEAVLRAIIDEQGLEQSLGDQAWSDPRFEDNLKRYRLAAAQLEVHATPTFFIGSRRLDGAVSFDELWQAAQLAADESQ
ncbi:DsbA family oxidoreductase [Thiohalobacter thiocyanaticus]|uniref:DsbA family protein n=1 Tax=Thiohalobacter thiocyanaticus TaxID=585455 RepID=A0A426QLQ1_9GAMM|nr:DsbA family protein [Thiohalobacter thiocyanaticus]RRQ22688.1 DsbA family protein [Thiohalobacter thiocyanaticus]